MKWGLGNGSGGARGGGFRHSVHPKSSQAANGKTGKASILASPNLRGLVKMFGLAGTLALPGQAFETVPGTRPHLDSESFCDLNLGL